MPLARSAELGATCIVTLSPQWSRVRRLLVMRLDNIGDVVMTAPALRAIRATLPDAHVTLMVSPAGAKAAPLLPWVDEVLQWRVSWQALDAAQGSEGNDRALVEALRARAFDAAIILTSFSQSPHPPAAAAMLAGIPLRLGASRERDVAGLLIDGGSPPDAVHQVERNLRLLESVGFRAVDRSLAVRIPEPARRRARERLAGHGCSPERPYLLLGPWASAQARTAPWPLFGAASRRLSALAGWRTVVVGQTGDRRRSEPLLEAIGPAAIDLVGATTVPELAALVEGAQLVLCNDTATMHLADAVRTPCVVLFAGTDLESQWQPRDAPARLLRRPTACRPCYLFSCPYGQECVDVPADDIVSAGLELGLARRRRKVPPARSG